MSTCQNCKASLSCGCQKRTASDGAPVCANCVGQYETSIKPAEPQQVTTIMYTKQNPTIDG